MDRESLSALIEKGFSLEQIEEEVKLSKTTIRYWIKKFSLKLKRGPKGKKPKDFVFARNCACGENDPSKFYGNKTTVCAKCHNAVNLAKGKDNRVYMLEALGNKCVNCGFDKWKSSLDLHHLDPRQKDIAFSTIRYWSKSRIDKELVKCVLLCKCCHAAHHSGELVNDKLIVTGIVV